MSLRNLAILAGLLLAACGSAADSQPMTYAQMNREQRTAFMSAVVLPQMQTIFATFEAKYQNMSCATCHGKGATDGTFAMPSPQIPPLPDSEEAFLEYIKDPEHARWSQFMLDKVLPKMADLLQEDKYDPAHPDGFSCSNCHTLMGH